MEQVDVLLRAEPVLLHHECSGNHDGVYRVSLRFAYVVPGMDEVWIGFITQTL